MITSHRQSDASKKDDAVRALFLQGPPSPFARELGSALAAQGAYVKRINLCAGDWYYWRGPDVINYRGSLSDWERYLETFVRSHGITDIVYFADRFPYHRIAQRVARQFQINAVSYEYGYLRPDWIIVEPGGQSAYSHFTRDLDVIRQAARDLPSPDLEQKYRYEFEDESRGDVIYHLSNYLLWFLFPRFQRDRVYNPILEYASYNPRFFRAWLNRKHAAEIVDSLRAGDTPYFIVPLQMQNDYQIRKNSSYADQRDFLKQVIGSFAQNAARDAKLVVKVHPLDNGIENWRKHVRIVARKYGIPDRVLYLDGGDLEQLAEQASGMVTINSTSGMLALRNSCPLKVMGAAVFDIPGLTHQGQLSSFWTESVLPDESCVADFVKVLAAHCHVRGDFYGREGRAAAVAGFAKRIMDHTLWPTVFETKAPRLDLARTMGIEIDL